MKYVNIQTVIAKLYRDIGEWEQFNFNYIVEWIGEVVSQVGTELVLTAQELEVKNFKAELPCGFVKEIALEYNGSRLRYSNDLRLPPYQTKGYTQQDDYLWMPYIQFVKRVDENGNIFYQRFQKDIDANLYPVQIQYNGEESYKINGDIFHFSFETGKVTLYYLEVYTDENGYPYVPDYDDLHEAILYYVLGKMISRGFQHPIYQGLQGLQIVENKYKENKVKASAQMTFPTPDQMMAFKNRFIKLMPNQFDYERFNNSTERRNNPRNISQ